MKKNRTNKNQLKRQAHTHIARSRLSKSAKRDMARRELLRLADEYGVGTKAAKIKLSDSHGAVRRGTRSRDNIRAEGIFSHTSSGFGFVCSEDYSGGDIFIPRSWVGGALDGDIVEVYFHEYTDDSGRTRTEGRITEVIEYGRRDIIGTLEEVIEYHGRHRLHTYVLKPDNDKFYRSVYISNPEEAELGDKVLAELDRRTLRADYISAKIVANFGKAESREANYLSILHECGIETHFTKEELAEAEAMSALPLSDEGRERVSDIVFTIDSESAKDLDDAISIRRTEDGYILSVHIADVSHYVREKTPLDRLVMSRATSVYFTDKVVPMLPEALSNGACSLNPHEDKYTLTARMKMDTCGQILSTEILPTIIRSELKGIYSEINQIFDCTANAEIREKYRTCLPSLEIMHELYLILKRRSDERGALELDSEEAYIMLNESGEPVDIIKRTRGDAERLIEQFMLAANEGVATLLTERGIPLVYRVHEAPPEEKLEDFIDYAKNLGLDTHPIKTESDNVKRYSELLNEAREAGLGIPISNTMLRSMSKARYSEIKRAHFGLGIDNYCHFTSPIRRLSDLATHRIIHRVLLEDKPAERYRSYAKRAAAAASEGELRALEAERKIENLYKVLYMKEHIGECYDAFISGVTSFGMFAMLDNTCEGLIPMSELDGYYIFDEKNISLRSDKNVYRIGMPIKVCLEEADITHGKLRFSLVLED